MSIPGIPIQFHDESIPRLPLFVGSLVTGEDPAGYLYGQRWTIVDIDGKGRAALRGCRARYSRSEIRDVRDKPPGAQIGWRRTVWDRAGYRVVRSNSGFGVSNCGKYSTKLQRGEELRDVWLSTQPNHVITNYNVHDEAVMMILAFNPDDVYRGDLDDSIVEVRVRRATLVDWQRL